MSWLNLSYADGSTEVFETHGESWVRVASEGSPDHRAFSADGLVNAEFLSDAPADAKKAEAAIEKQAKEKAAAEKEAQAEAAKAAKAETADR